MANVLAKRLTHRWAGIYFDLLICGIIGSAFSRVVLPVPAFPLLPETQFFIYWTRTLLFSGASRSMSNTLEFVLDTLNTLNNAGIQAWVFGGWAEELWQMIPPRPHHDLDLLFRGSDFQPVDSLLAANPVLFELHVKHFSHKRAFRNQDVLVELIRVEQTRNQFTTTFFTDKCTLIWPPDTFQFTCQRNHRLIQTASPNALKWYRSQHRLVEEAYQKHILG
jgi:hypothetical protein